MAAFIHIPFNQREFSRWAGTQGRGLIGEHGLDTGLAMHVLVSSVFPKGSVQPYRVIVPQRKVVGAFYAYTKAAPDELAEIASTAIGPDSADVFNLDAMRSRPLPNVAVGQRIGFDVRIRPTKRGRGHEADAYLMNGREWAMQKPPHKENGESAPTREKVYADWFAQRLQGAAELRACRIAHFMQNRAAFGRNRNAINLPDATLHGDMTISDPAAFHEKLIAGVGRHKAYGYGMILLRPPTVAV